MTHEAIEKIIDEVNAGSAIHRIFSWPLRANVRTARVWIHDPLGDNWDENGYNFYLIYSGDTCAGAALDMGFDLHVFTKPVHRRKGLMFAALKQIIIPHVFSTGRTKLESEIHSDEGRCLLQKLGFQFIDPTHAVLTSPENLASPFPCIPPDPLNEEQSDCVQQLVWRASSWLKVARDALGPNIAPDLRDEFEHHINSVHNLANQVHEACRKLNNDHASHKFGTKPSSPTTTG